MDTHKWESTRWAFDMMKKEGIIPDEAMYHSLIFGFAKGGQTDGALMLFEEARSNSSVKLSARLYADALYACAEEGASEKALQLFATMKDVDQIQPNIKVYANVVRACSHGRQWEKALQLYDECLASYEGRPSLHLYNGALHACQLGHKAEKAELIFEAIKADERLEPDNDTYEQLIKAFERDDRWRERVIQLRGELLSVQSRHVQRGSCLPREQADLITKMRLWKDRGQWKRALNVVEDSSLFGSLDGSTKEELCFCALVACARAGKMENIESVYRTFMAVRERPDINTECHNNLISIGKKLKDKQKASAYFQQMSKLFQEEFSCYKPSQKNLQSYRALSGLFKHCQDWKLVIEIYEEATHSCSSPDPVLLKHAMEAYFESGQKERALQLRCECPDIHINRELLKKLETIETFAEIVGTENSDVSRELLSRRMDLVPRVMKIFEVKRVNDDCFKQKLDESLQLQVCHASLESHSYQPVLPGGARIYVLPNQYEAALRALPSVPVTLKFYHFVCSSAYDHVLRDVIRSVPSRNQVRLKFVKSFESMPIYDEELGGTLCTRSGFIHAQVPHSTCSDFGVAMKLPSCPAAF